MKNTFEKWWGQVEKHVKGFATIIVTAWMLSGCGWWGSNWNEGWNWQDVEKTAPIKVVDGPVKNADVFLISSDGTEIKIWKTDNNGSIKLSKEDLKWVNGKIVIKTNWWEDEKWAINGEFYLPAMTKEQLQSFIENNETININPTTTYFYKITKETWWTLHEALQKYNIKDKNWDGKVNVEDLAKYDYTWTYKGIVSQDPNDDGISFEEAIRDGDEWAFQDDIEALQNEENTHINTFAVNNSDVSFGHDLNVSFDASDKNGLENVILTLQDNEWNEYTIKQYDINSSELNKKLSLKPVLVPAEIKPDYLLNKNELALRPWKYTFKLTAEWKQWDFDTNNFVEQDIDLNISNKLQAFTSATSITEWDSVNLSVEGIADWYEDAFDITWYDENNNEVWTSVNLEDFVPNVWNHTYHAVIKEWEKVIAETEKVSIEVKEIPNQAPEISISASATSITEWESVTLTANASDSDGSVSSIIWYDGNGNQIWTWESISVSPSSVWTYTYYAIAIDNDGAKTRSNSVSIEVINNTPSFSFEVASGEDNSRVEDTWDKVNIYIHTPDTGWTDRNADLIVHVTNWWYILVDGVRYNDWDHIRFTDEQEDWNPTWSIEIYDKNGKLVKTKTYEIIGVSSL